MSVIFTISDITWVFPDSSFHRIPSKYNIKKILQFYTLDRICPGTAPNLPVDGTVLAKATLQKDKRLATNEDDYVLCAVGLWAFTVLTSTYLETPSIILTIWTLSSFSYRTKL